MALDLQNKKVLITGSTDGLGKLLAIELAKLGSEVIIHGKSEEKAEEILIELKKVSDKNHSYIICDLNKPESLTAAFLSVDELDILINNAGIWQEGDTVNTEPQKIIELVNVNIASYLLMTRNIIPKLLDSEFGQVLNVISVAGYEVPSDYYHTIYSATKYALQGFSEALAKEFDNKNLRIMGYYPGGMSTKLFEKAGIDYEDKEPWMFDPIESVEAIIFMLTRNKKVSVKRMDLINHLQQ